VLVGGAYLVWRERHDLAVAVDQLSLGRFVLSGVLAVVGTVLIERTWWALLAGLLDGGGGTRPTRRSAEAMFYVTQLGKYLPGSVWPVVAQMEFGRRWGLPRSIMLAANMLLLAVVTASGIVAGAVLLPWTSPDGLTRYWWLLVLLVPLAAVLHPRVVPWALDRLLVRLGREPVGAVLTGAGLARALAWSLATWVVLGLHLAVLLAAYDALDPATTLASVGAIGLAWAAGLAFIPAPAGAGVREAVLVATFAPFVGTAAALTLALASRVLLLVADVLLAALGALLRR